MNKIGGLGALVALDLATKALAYGILPLDTQVQEDALFQLVLRVNERGFGTLSAPVVSRNPPLAVAVAGVATAAIGVYILALPALSRRGWPVLGRVLAGIAVYVGSWFLAAEAIPAMGGVTLAAAMMLSRTGGTSFAIALWWRAESRPWQICTTFFAAAGLGNLLCMIPPPHGIVDYMYSAPMRRAFHMEIFNLADVYFNVALVLFLVALVHSVVFRFGADETSEGG